MGLDVVRELAAFLWERKAWWLVPLFVLLAIAAALILISESAIVSGFVYTLF